MERRTKSGASRSGGEGGGSHDVTSTPSCPMTSAGAGCVALSRYCVLVFKRTAGLPSTPTHEPVSTNLTYPAIPARISQPWILSFTCYTTSARGSAVCAPLSVYSCRVWRGVTLYVHVVRTHAYVVQYMLYLHRYI